MWMRQFTLTYKSHAVTFKGVPGADPELLLLNKDDKVVERFSLLKKNRDECNELLLQSGFYKKSSQDEVVPEEFANGPYFKREEL
ncbi:hypothetical protein ScPMuIL_007192 [Solemya velum]